MSGAGQTGTAAAPNRINSGVATQSNITTTTNNATTQSGQNQNLNQIVSAGITERHVSRPFALNLICEP